MNIKKTGLKVLERTSLWLSLAFIGTALLAEGLSHAPGRSLHDNEEQMLRDIFKDSVRYEDTLLSDIFFVNSYLHLTGKAMGSIDNKIFYNEEVRSYDFSQSGAHARAALVHEMAHVWQRQNCIKENSFTRTAKHFQAQVKDDPAIMYSYKLEVGKDLTAYGIEQQASIISDYYLILNEYYPLSLEKQFSGWEENKITLANTARLYERTALKNFLEDPSYGGQFCQQKQFISL